MFSTILQVLINSFISVSIILIFHYSYNHIFKKKTKDLDNTQNEKYKKIVEEIEEIQHVKNVESSQSSPFKTELEKEQMNDELMKFIDSELTLEPQEI